MEQDKLPLQYQQLLALVVRPMFKIQVELREMVELLF